MPCGPGGIVVQPGVSRSNGGFNNFSGFNNNGFNRFNGDALAAPAGTSSGNAGSSSASAAGFGSSSASSGGSGNFSGSGSFSNSGSSRRSNTAFERSRVANFLRSQVEEIYIRLSPNKTLNLTENFKNQNFVSFSDIPDTTEGILYFSQILGNILSRDAADRENETTLLDLRNQLNKIAEGQFNTGKEDGTIGTDDLDPRTISLLDQTVQKLDELIDDEQERKARLAQQKADREARQANNANPNANGGGGGGSGGGSGGGGSSPLSLPPAPPGQPPQPIEQPQHSPDPSFVENTNRFLQESASAFNQLSGLFPNRKEDVLDTIETLIGTMPKPPTKATAPLDTAGILSLQQRELANTVNVGVPPMQTLFPQVAGGSGFLANIQAFTQGGAFSRISGTALANSRANPPARFPASPVGIASSLVANRFSVLSGVTSRRPRLAIVPDFQTLFQPSASYVNRDLATTTPTTPIPRALTPRSTSRNRSVHPSASGSRAPSRPILQPRK